jgi:hypothetical protein
LQGLGLNDQVLITRCIGSGYEVYANGSCRSAVIGSGKFVNNGRNAISSVLGNLRVFSRFGWD